VIRFCPRSVRTTTPKLDFRHCYTRFLSHQTSSPDIPDVIYLCSLRNRIEHHLRETRGSFTVDTTAAMPDLFIHRQRLAGRWRRSAQTLPLPRTNSAGKDRSTAAPRRLPPIIVLLNKQSDGRTVALGPSKSSRVKCQATDAACSVDD
jgi:hypothetical protein